jgi:hypothetical protein
MRAPPPCSLAALPQRASPENQITEGKPLPLEDSSGNLPRSPAAGCGVAAGTAAKTRNPTASSCVGHEI